MRECYGHRAFADGRRAALHGAMAHIARGEHTGNVGLQVVRIAVQRPALGRRSIEQQVRSCDQIAGCIALNAHFHGPIGMRHAPDADKQPVCCEGLLLAGVAIGQGNLAQNLVSVQTRYYGACEHANIGRGLDAVDQLLRHRLVERVFHRDDRYSFGESREVQRGLSGGVPPAHHENIFIAA